MRVYWRLLAFICILRFASGLQSQASIGAVSLPGRPALLEKPAHTLDAIGISEVVDHRQRGDGIGLIERLLDLGVEGALADRQRRGGLLSDGLASAWASSSARPSGTTRLTRPKRRPPRRYRVVRSSPSPSLACAISHGRPPPRGRAEQAEIHPRQAEAGALAATARSQAATSWQPAAVTTPSIAAMTGFGSATTACMRAEQRANRST